MGVGGDVPRDGALPLPGGLRGEWRPEGDAPPLTPHAWERETRPGVYVLPGDFDQCHVRAGRTAAGLTELSDDYPEAQLLDFGLGYLRIFYRTRSEGLSYGTTTRLVANADRGEFYVMGSTRPDKLVDLLRAVREEVEAVAARPLDEGEATTARTFMLGTKVRGMETAGDIVRTRLAEVAKGFPDGYTERLVSGLQAATPASVAAAAERYVGIGEAPVVVVVGMPEGGVEALEALGWGPVTVLEPVAFGE
ncbi:insulinase family protein [bacterium]|nr:insulinase family protein [bacterium]